MQSRFITLVYKGKSLLLFGQYQAKSVTMYLFESQRLTICFDRTVIILHSCKLCIIGSNHNFLHSGVSTLCFIISSVQVTIRYSTKSTGKITVKFGSKIAHMSLKADRYFENLIQMQKFFCQSKDFVCLLLPRHLTRYLTIITQ